MPKLVRPMLAIICAGTIIVSALSTCAKQPVRHRQLTREERISGLEKLWKAVKHNFAWFDQVPDLDWDKALQEYLPRAAREQTNAEYYKLLQEFLALLQDGHTSVGLKGYNWGRHMWQMMEAPPISIQNIRGKAVIVGLAETDEIKEADLSPGTEITKVD